MTRLNNIRFTRKRQRRIFVLAKLCILLALLSGSVFGQTGDISIENKVDNLTMTIGDRITYSLIVTHAPEIEVVLPGRAFVVLDTAFQMLPDDALNISDYKIIEAEEVEGKIVEGVEYIFSPFLVGKFTIASLTVKFKTATDTSYSRINAEPIQFVVESMKPSETGDIRDNKTQWEVERDIWIILKPVLFGLLMVGLIVLAIIMLRRRRAGKALLPGLEKPPRPAHEIALEQLDELIKSDLLERREFKLFYSRISDIIRKYIEGRYYIVALEMTSTELIQNMREVEIEDEIIDAVHDFVSLSDLVKFAKYTPGEEENQLIVQAAYDLVNRTKIELAEPAVAEESSSANTEEVVVEDGEKKPVENGITEEPNREEPQ